MMKRSVVITGGNRGIGAATAILAARNGWDVCISYNRHGAEADDIVPVSYTHLTLPTSDLV